MNWRNKLDASWRSALGGAVLCAALGLSFLWLAPGQRLVLLSYDLLFLFRHTPPLDEVVIIYMDERSFAELAQQNAGNWDRNVHAQLLERLTADQCRVAVFDIIFSEPGSPAANTNLARAIQRNGKVVLAAALDYHSRPQIKVKGAVHPLAEFERVAAGWGLAEVLSGPGRAARQYYHGHEYGPGLAWTAAKVAGAEVAASTLEPASESWLNYYGRALAIPNVSYSEALHLPAGFFRGKCVFIGARPKTLRAHDEADEFTTPHTLWTGEYFPGVEISATAFLNLLRRDDLMRMSWPMELALVLMTGLGLGGGFSLARPAVAGALAIAGASLMLLAAIQAAGHHVWFAWTVIALAQIPGALVWSLRCHFHRLKFEKAVLERTLMETSRGAGTAKGSTAAPSGLVIPDHTLVRRVGKGAYGEVWLARNTIGVHHAVKLVQRREFPSDEPYEREYRGIQKFMPISRSHPGLVHVLHMGRNDAEGFFFYIMEAGDDETAGQRIDPERYAPKTLATELARLGKLPPEECLSLGLALALALEHLHQQQLVHRDIKPGNIIYVNGAPKFADIGLVTDLAERSQAASHVGTEGYIPPEGPGTAAADVYALGKVLYEASMGRDRRLFPEVPTTVWEQPRGALLRELNTVIGRACETAAHQRYPSARELHGELLKLQNLMNQRG